MRLYLKDVAKKWGLRFYVYQVVKDFLLSTPGRKPPVLISAISDNEVFSIFCRFVTDGGSTFDTNRVAKWVYDGNTDKLQQFEVLRSRWFELWDRQLLSDSAGATESVMVLALNLKLAEWVCQRTEDIVRKGAIHEDKLKGIDQVFIEWSELKILADHWLNTEADRRGNKKSIAHTYNDSRLKKAMGIAAGGAILSEVGTAKYRAWYFSWRRVRIPPLPKFLPRKSKFPDMKENT